MPKIDELSRSLLEKFEAVLLEDGNVTGVRLHYHSLSKLDIQGLLEDLPPYVRIDWYKGALYSNDGESYLEAQAREFDFFKLLDPRLILNYRTFEVIGARDLRQIKGQLVLGRYNTEAMNLPHDLLEWFKANGQSMRPLVFVLDDQPMIRLMSQPDIPPSRSIVSLFFQRPGEEVDTVLICHSLPMAMLMVRRGLL